MRLEIFLNGEEPYKQDWLAVNDYFYHLMKPRDYSDSSEGENSFERLCAVLEDNGAVNAAGLTVHQFFNRCKYCENKYKTK